MIVKLASHFYERDRLPGDSTEIVDGVLTVVRHTAAGREVLARYGAGAWESVHYAYDVTPARPPRETYLDPETREALRRVLAIVVRITPNIDTLCGNDDCPVCTLGCEPELEAVAHLSRLVTLSALDAQLEARERA